MTLDEPGGRLVEASEPSTPRGGTADPASGGLLGEPVVFAGRVGWLHWPSRRRTKDAARTPGVVLCSAIGRDEGYSHVAIRLLAEALARAGFAVLRYDHLGEGESLDLADDADALPEWLTGVDLAIDLVKMRAGVETVVVGGFRFGASLAMLAGGNADGVMLLAPILSGKSWVRELRLRAAFGLAQSDLGDGALESDGLRLSSATLASLQNLDVARSGCLPPRAICFCPTPAMASQVQSIMPGTGVVEPFDGYGAFIEDPDASQVPKSVLSRAVDWIERSYPAEPGASDLMAVAALTEPTPVLRAPGWTESQVGFGAGLRGVLCLPENAKGRAVLICNTGAEPRRGIGRFAVQAARTLAAHGFASLRFDFAGIGDSPLGEGQSPMHVFDTPRGADIAAAANLLRARGLSQITVMGLCSGAYHAIHAALENDQIDQAFAIGPARVAPTLSAQTLATQQDRGRSTAAYLDRLGDQRHWRRLLTGQIDVAVVAKTLILRFNTRLQTMINRKQAGALLGQMAALSRRNGRIVMLIGAEDAGLDEAQAYFGPRGERLRGLAGMSLLIDPDLDHAVALAKSRALAIRELLAFMQR